MGIYLHDLSVKDLLVKQREWNKLQDELEQCTDGSLAKKGLMEKSEELEHEYYQIFAELLRKEMRTED